MALDSAGSWPGPVKGLHWVVAALVLVQIPLGWAAASWPLSPMKLDLFVWHKSTGMLILALMALRVVVRLATRSPALPAAMPRWERRAARVSHVLLYALLVALPFTGWIVNSAANIPFRIFWLLPLPSIVAPDEATADLAALAHRVLFVVLGTVLVVHVGAALRHHYVNRDDVLVRMLPGTRRRGGLRRTADAKAVTLLVALLLLGGAHRAYPADWRMEASGSRLEFVATFERAPAPGVFRDFDARVRFDPGDLADSRIDVTVAVTSADLRNTDVNKTIRGPDWFDFARFPNAEFRAADVRRSGPDRFIARGILTVKGVQQPIELPFRWSETGDLAAMEGEVTVTRGAFGIGVGEWQPTDVIGADVKVSFRVRLRRVG